MTITQLELALTPDLPRIVRLSDTTYIRYPGTVEEMAAATVLLPEKWSEHWCGRCRVWKARGYECAVGLPAGSAGPVRLK